MKSVLYVNCNDKLGSLVSMTTMSLINHVAILDHSSQIVTELLPKGIVNTPLIQYTSRYGIVHSLQWDSIEYPRHIHGKYSISATIVNSAVVIMGGKFRPIKGDSCVSFVVRSLGLPDRWSFYTPRRLYESHRNIRNS